MKKVLNSIWDLLIAWGEFRYEMVKKRGFAMYY
jgi:hypothetical protein